MVFGLVIDAHVANKRVAGFLSNRQATASCHMVTQHITVKIVIKL